MHDVHVFAATARPLVMFAEVGHCSCHIPFAPNEVVADIVFAAAKILPIVLCSLHEGKGA